MGVMDQIASALDQKVDIPNIALAEKLSQSGDRYGVQELVSHLDDIDKSVQSDCIKVLYEIGYRNPMLIADFVEDFLGLLSSRNKRLVWGGMIALSTIASLKADILFQHFDQIQKAVETGSVITTDAGIKALSLVADVSPEYHHKIFPDLLTRLRSCRSKSVARYSEFVAMAVTPESLSDFVTALKKRYPDLSPSQLRRVRKVIASVRSANRRKQ